MKAKEITVKYQKIRAYTEEICKPLKVEDYVPQPNENVSPPKWHLAHTTWFFEQFILGPNQENYTVFDADFGYLFNSYYNHFGDRLLQPNRGLMTRPSVKRVYEYRAYVNKHIEAFFKSCDDQEIYNLLEIGLNHEQQHQELLIYDIKYILGFQPTFPVYGNQFQTHEEKDASWIELDEGVYEVGAKSGFCFDNEQPRHKTYCHKTAIRKQLVTNGEFVEFIEAGGYQNHEYWLSEGWDFIKENKIEKPLYWYDKKGKWFNYTLGGLKPIAADLPVQHVSFYEAMAFAEWKGCRLPTEFEWELLADQFNWGQLWEWTNSAYLPYPGYKRQPGALGEYNGKFMINQNVLKGSSVATSEGHSRKTYRNFFHAKERWIFSGFRLAKSI
jgi:ergothioneine biosynthesis protein EgtB